MTGFETVDLNGTLHVADAVAEAEKVDLVTAYEDAAGRAVTLPLTLDARMTPTPSSSSR